MDEVLAEVTKKCLNALESPDPQSAVETILLKAAKDPAVLRAISVRTKFASLQDLAIYRSERLTLLAGSVPPGVLPNAAGVIHAIRNPLDEPLVVLHAYGGDLFGTPRSNWDPETHEEIPFDWKKVAKS